MIKVFMFLRRRPELSRAEFLAYWSGPHKDLAVSTAGVLRLQRYVQNHPAEHPFAEVLRAGRGARAADFDGVAEAWWDSFEELSAIGNTAGEIAARVLQDEARFLDLPRCEMWFATEHEFVQSGR
jgi:hypothetical protein